MISKSRAIYSDLVVLINPIIQLYRYYLVMFTSEQLISVQIGCLYLR